MLLSLGAHAQEQKCELIDSPNGGRYLECDPQKAKAAKEENAAAARKSPPKPPPGHSQSVEEFAARMAIENAKTDAERAEARAKADAIRAEDQKKRAATEAREEEERAAARARVDVIRADEQKKRAAVKAKEEANFKSSGTKGAWRASVDQNKMDSRARLTLILEGTEPLPNSIRPRPPALVIRCEAGRVDLYLNARTHLAGPSDELGEHSFRVKYDDGKPERLRGNKATSSDAVFFPSAALHVKRLRAAHRLMVEVTPYTFAEATTTFAVTGLDEHRAAIQMHCGV